MKANRREERMRRCGNCANMEKWGMGRGQCTAGSEKNLPMWITDKLSLCARDVYTQKKAGNCFWWEYKNRWEGK